MTKHEIIANALDVFRTYGIKSTSMDDLAARFGISKKTIYQHFDNKEQLLAACVKLSLDLTDKSVDDVRRGDEHPIIKIVLIYFRLFNQLITYQSVFFFDVRRYYPQITSLVEAYREAFIQRNITDLFAAAAARGCLDAGVKTDLVIKLYLYRFDELADQAFRGNPQENTTDLFRHLVIYKLRGILSNECITLLDNLKLELYAPGRPGIGHGYRP